MSRKYKLQKHLAVAVLYIIRHWHTGKKYMRKRKNQSVKADCNNYCNRQLKKEYEWLKKWINLLLTNAIYNMDAAYQKFFKEHAGYPKFKK